MAARLIPLRIRKNTARHVHETPIGTLRKPAVGLLNLEARESKTFLLSLLRPYAHLFDPALAAAGKLYAPSNTKTTWKIRTTFFKHSGCDSSV